MNHIKGYLNLPNGRISKITMSSGWQNKNNTSNNFYFYHDGMVMGTYKVATIEIVITDSGEYTISGLQYGINKCVNENNLYFGEIGRIVTESTYNNTCSLSDDATLKSLTPSIGTLTPSFEREKVAYHISVNKEVTSINFKAVPNHEKARVQSGTTCALNYGFNTCEIVVESERKTTKKYYVYVYRQPESNSTIDYDSNITNFEVHNGTLDKAFNQEVYEYKVKVNKGAEKIYFTFLTDGGKTSHTSNTCNAYADSCKLTVSLPNNTQKSYTFYFINEDTIRPNTPSEPSVVKPTPSTNKPNTSSATKTENTENKKPTLIIENKSDKDQETEVTTNKNDETSNTDNTEKNNSNQKDPINNQQG